MIVHFASGKQAALAAAAAVAINFVGVTPAFADAAEAELPVPLAVRYAAKQQTAEGETEQFGKLFKLWKSVERSAGPAFAQQGADENGQGQKPVSLARLAAPRLRVPVRGFTMTSGFGMRLHPLLGGRRPHLGIDLAARAGAPVFATADGIVSLAGWRGGYGLSVALEHGRGTQTRYGHMSRLNVANGQRVRKGDVIGFVGSTGRSTGPHLHYETRVNGQAVNPLPYIRGK